MDRMREGHGYEEYARLAIRTTAEDPFRCCTASRSLDCCSLYDDKFYSFCDKWPHREDAQGQVCPDGNWRCMFKLSQGDGKTVEELVVYDPPGHDHLLVAIACCSLMSLLSCLADRIAKLASRCSRATG